MPHELPIFTDLLLLLLAAIPIAFVCQRLRLPVIVGFMVTGIVIGPSALGLIKDHKAIEFLAEIGVALLLFTIGLEFSLRRLLEMKRLVLGGGGLQVVLTILATLAIAVAWGRSLNQSLFFGFLVTLSSTAIVLKSYQERQEIDTLHGKAGVGILLFQDLCLVPMMLLTPILSGREGSSLTNVALKLGTALAVVAGIIFTARTLVPYLLYHIVRLRSPEIFIGFVVLVSLGTAWLTSHFGLSMALGAFIAGLVLSESEYSHQIVSDILPFRDVFNSIFFISIGMLLSLGSLAAHWPFVLFWTLVLLAGKALLIIGVALALGYSLRIAAIIGFGLAQVGEFSFILAKVGEAQGLLSVAENQLFLAAAILTMMLTPFVISAAPRLGLALQTRWKGPSPVASESEEASAPSLTQHVIVIGYGMNGRNLTKVLHHVNIPFVVLELNAETVRTARAQGVPIHYGDAGRREVLQHLGVQRAAVLVLAISDPLMTRHVTALAHEINPVLKILVRTRYMSEVAELFQLGASEVIPEEFETSVEIFARVLREYGVPRFQIQQETDAIRSEGYQMLRAPSLPLVEQSRLAEAFATTATDNFFISSDSPLVGQTLKALDLRNQAGATVAAYVRHDKLAINPAPDFKIEAEDILILLGHPEQLERALDCLTRLETHAPPSEDSSLANETEQDIRDVTALSSSSQLQLPHD